MKEYTEAIEELMNAPKSFRQIQTGGTYGERLQTTQSLLVDAQEALQGREADRVEVIGREKKRNLKRLRSSAAVQSISEISEISESKAGGLKGGDHDGNMQTRQQNYQYQHQQQDLLQKQPDMWQWVRCDNCEKWRRLVVPDVSDKTYYQFFNKDTLEWDLDWLEEEEPKNYNSSDEDENENKDKDRDIDKDEDGTVKFSREWVCSQKSILCWNIDFDLPLSPSTSAGLSIANQTAKANAKAKAVHSDSRAYNCSVAQEFYVESLESFENGENGENGEIGDNGDNGISVGEEGNGASDVATSYKSDKSDKKAKKEHGDVSRTMDVEPLPLPVKGQGQGQGGLQLQLVKGNNSPSRDSRDSRDPRDPRRGSGSGSGSPSKDSRNPKGNRSPTRGSPIRGGSMSPGVGVSKQDPDYSASQALVVGAALNALSPASASASAYKSSPSPKVYKKKRISDVDSSDEEVDEPGEGERRRQQQLRQQQEQEEEEGEAQWEESPVKGRGKGRVKAGQEQGQSGEAITPTRARSDKIDTPSSNSSTRGNLKKGIDGLLDDSGNGNGSSRKSNGTSKSKSPRSSSKKVPTPVAGLAKGGSGTDIPPELFEAGSDLLQVSLSLGFNSRSISLYCWCLVSCGVVR